MVETGVDVGCGVLLDEEVEAGALVLGAAVVETGVDVGCSVLLEVVGVGVLLLVGSPKDGLDVVRAATVVV